MIRLRLLLTNITNSMAANKKKSTGIRAFAVVLFFIYFLVLFYFLFFSEEMGRTYVEREYHYNLIPFREIVRFYTYREIVGFKAYALNLFGNIIAFIPFGFMVPILNWRCRQMEKVACISFYLSITIECIQFISRVGAFDVDDLILNTLGGILGYCVLCVANQIRRCWFGQIW